MLVLFTSSLCLAQYKIKVDLEQSFKTTALLNIGMDFYQTHVVLKDPYNYDEKNNFYVQLYDRGGSALFSVGFVALHYLEYRAIESIKDKTLRTLAWGAYAFYQYSLVRNNRYDTHGVGFPLFWIQFKFK